MRKAILILILLSILISLGSCSNFTTQENTLKEVRFSYQDGTPALTSAKLAFENSVLDKNMRIIYELEKSPDSLLAKILKQEADIAIVPSNIAAQAVNKGLPYKIVGTAVWGSLYLAGTENIKSFEELKGKEIYSFGKD